MAYTTIDDPSEYFHTRLYTGSGSSGLQVRNNANAGDFSPDFLWLAPRSNGDNNVMFDSSRGFNKQLKANGNDAEDTHSPVRLTKETNGFDVDTTDTNYNGSSRTYVAWQWIANNGTTATISAGGDIGRETVSQVSTTAGFNICTYSGSGSQSSFGHSLGAKPHWIIIKNRSQADDWFVWVEGMNNNQGLEINTTDAVGTTNGYMGNEAPTSVFVGLGDGHNTNASSENYVAYLWTSIQGYSQFGIYEGNGSEAGPFVYTGFKPEWILFKNLGAAEEWVLQDTTRNPINPVTKNIRADSNIAEADASSIDIDFLSNGFKNRSDQAQLNSDGVNYAYIAFAEHPFVSSEGVPTTAR